MARPHQQRNSLDTCTSLASADKFEHGKRQNSTAILPSPQGGYTLADRAVIGRKWAMCGPMGGVGGTPLTGEGLFFMRFAFGRVAGALVGKLPALYLAVCGLRFPWGTGICGAIVGV